MGEIVAANLEKRGRPESKAALDMEGRWPHIPAGFIKAYMITDFERLVTYLSNLEVLSDDMLSLLLDDDYGLEARYELLDSWATELEEVLGTRSTPAATGAVTTGSSLMAYIKQLVTELQVVDALIDTIVAGAPTVGEIQAEMEEDGASILDTLQDRLTNARAGYLDQLDFNLQEAIAALNTLLSHGTYGLAALETLVDEIETYLKHGTYGLDALQTLLAAITAAGPTLTQMNTAHALLATPAQVATALNNYDAIKRSEATTDKNAIITEVDANEAKIDTIDGIVDTLLTRITAAVATATALTAAKAVIDAIKTIVDTPANFMADLSTLETRLPAVLSAIRIGYLDQLDFNLQEKLVEIDGEVEGLAGAAMRGTDNAATEAKQDIIDTAVDGIKTSTDKLAGASPTVGTATEDWNTAEADVVSIGVNDTKNKLHSLVLDISGLTASATITIRMYMQVNGNEKMVYEQDFVVDTDPDGLWIVNGTVAIHEVLRVTAESDDATDDGLTIAYDYMLEVM